MTTIDDDTPIIIGLGCSSAAAPDEIIALVNACLTEAGLSATQILAFATHVRKRGSEALSLAASHFDLPLRLLEDDDLALRVPGTCEAVAAAAGPIVLTKRKTRFATCAIARVAPGFALAAFGQPSFSAAIASSTEATSWAGP